MAMSLRTRPATGLMASRRPSLRPAVVCKAQLQEEAKPQLAAAALLASGILMLNAVAPAEAEAARSSGRVGGSSGFKSRKVETRARGQMGGAYTRRSSNTTVINSTTVVPAPVMAPPVYASPFGFGGFSIMPTFVVPIPMFGETHHAAPPAPVAPAPAPAAPVTVVVEVAPGTTAAASVPAAAPPASVPAAPVAVVAP